MNEKYPAFPKISRITSSVVITEKIDGTNGLISVGDDGRVRAGSRRRWLNPSEGVDNYGFGAWVEQHQDRLRESLGPGLHYGEWWGAGIQRGYCNTWKTFSLFNTGKWLPLSLENVRLHEGGEGFLVGGLCSVVPVLFEGKMGESQQGLYTALGRLQRGSVAAPGYAWPEGVVVFWKDTGMLQKVIIDKQ